jgi:alpha-N-arabinofuranosidase
MLTSLLGSDKDKGTFKTPLFYTFKLFSNNCLGNSVDTYVECDTFNTQNYKGILYLDATTVYSKETNTLFVNVINRSKVKAITAYIINSNYEFTGKAEASVINCASLTDPFTFDKQGQYIPISNEVKIEKEKITYSFPAHSFTQIKIELKK